MSGGFSEPRADARARADIQMLPTIRRCASAPSAGSDLSMLADSPDEVGRARPPAVAKAMGHPEPGCGEPVEPVERASGSAYSTRWHWSLHMNWRARSEKDSRPLSELPPSRTGDQGYWRLGFGFLHQGLSPLRPLPCRAHTRRQTRRPPPAFRLRNSPGRVPASARVASEIRHPIYATKY